MAADNIEIEIQVKIEHATPLLGFLEKNAKFREETRQIDEYYSPTHRDFIAVRPIKEWLRIRNSNGKYSVNYKNWHYDNGRSTHADEYETSIESPDKMRNIFQVLNFKNVATVDKIRKIWDYKDWEVSIDSIKNLGDFVEIEYKGSSIEDPKKITAEMTQFLKDIGCGKVERNYVGYPFQLMFPEEVKFEEQ